jgi:hypothetical protein
VRRHLYIPTLHLVSSFGCATATCGSAMSKADTLSAGLTSVGGRLVGLFLLMALPGIGSLTGVLSSGNYSVGAFVGVCVYFFTPLLILRFMKRGERRSWNESCRKAFWVALVFVLIAIGGQNYERSRIATKL